ncbi:GNAT family N-acetyltransferase [bacterium]|nr:GNAT family N-acetyltransferase [bacterium]
MAGPDFLADKSSEPFDLQPATDYSLATLAEIFTGVYSDYFFPVKMDAETLSWIICTQSIDLAASRVASIGTIHAGVIFISTRGLSQRVAAMGVLPDHRGQGLGRRLIRHSIENARANGFRRMVLEVIDENAKALTLYRAMGFEITRRLVGYERLADDKVYPDIEKLEELDPRDVAKAIVHDGTPGLPWQRTADGFYAIQPPSRAFTIPNRAFAIISHLTDKQAHIEAILVPRARRRQGWGTRMLHSLFATYPGRTWWVTATVPEDLAPDFFLNNGFKKGALRQYEMVLNLERN